MVGNVSVWTGIKMSSVRKKNGTRELQHEIGSNRTQKRMPALQTSAYFTDGRVRRT